VCEYQGGKVAGTGANCEEISGNEEGRIKRTLASLEATPETREAYLANIMYNEEDKDSLKGLGENEKERGKETTEK